MHRESKNKKFENEINKKYKIFSAVYNFISTNFRNNEIGATMLKSIEVL